MWKLTWIRKTFDSCLSIFRRASDKSSLDSARDAARDCIQSNNVNLVEKWSCEVRKRKGEKKIGDMWCWMSHEWKQYVGGLCWGNVIEVGCDPNTGEVNFDVVKHEFGHYWLISNFGDYGHDTKYQGCFRNWRQPKIMVSVFDLSDDEQKTVVSSVSETLDRGEWFYIDDLSVNGIQCHIDFVKEIK